MKAATENVSVTDSESTAAKRSSEDTTQSENNFFQAQAAVQKSKLGGTNVRNSPGKKLQGSGKKLGQRTGSKAALPPQRLSTAS